MRYEMILSKVNKLAEIYADPNLGARSAEAEEIISILAKEKAQDVDKALRSAKIKAKTKQIRDEIMPAITADLQTLINNPLRTDVPTPPKSDIEEIHAPQIKDTEIKPQKQSEEKNDEVNKKSGDERKSQSREILPPEIAKDLHDYLYTDADDYSDSLGDYISKSGISARDKRSHALNLLSALKKENYKPLQAGIHLDRSKLVGLTMMIYGEFIKTPEAAVQKKIDDVLKRISARYQRGYVARASQNNVYREDLYIKDIMAARNPDRQDYIDKVIAGHVTELLEKLDDTQKAKYVAVQKRKGYKDYMPEININIKENDSKNQKKKKGENPMADDVKEGVFTPSEVQKKACEFAGLDWKKYKDNDSISKAIAEQGLLINGNQIIDMTTESLVATVEPKTEEEKKKKEAYDHMNGDEGLSPEDLPSKEDKKAPALTFDKLDKDKEREEPQPEQPKPWVQKKIEHYTELAQTGKIQDFSYDKENKNEFVASFDGASIHYSSPDNVQVSEKAGIKVFETILNEEDNKNRDINFADNMPHDMAIHLKAACLLNDRTMIGSQPDFTQEDLEKLNQELGAERFKELQEKIAAQNQQKSLPSKTQNSEITEEKADKPLTESVQKLQEIRQEFEKMKTDGLIAVQTNKETKMPEIVSGPALSGKSVEEKLEIVKAANALIAEAGALVKSGAKTQENTQGIEAKTNDAFNQERLQHIRENMNQDKLAAHEAKADQVALIHAKRMGLTDVDVKDRNGNEVQTIEDKAQRDAYAEARNKNPELSARIAKVVKQQQATK